MARNKSIAVNEAERTLVAHARAVMRLREKRARAIEQLEGLHVELAEAEQRLAGLLPTVQPPPPPALPDQHAASRLALDATEELAGAAR